MFLFLLVRCLHALIHMHTQVFSASERSILNIYPHQGKVRHMLVLTLSSGFNLCLDESGPLKSPWGINIMKKTKKVVPKAFGVRLEDCQPGVNNKVGADH